MSYRLIFAPSFEGHIQDKIDWLRDQNVSEPTIEAWLVKLYRQIQGIEVWPRLYPIDEAYSAEVGLESRKINFQKYLVFYQVDDEQREVRVVGFIDGGTREDA